MALVATRVLLINQQLRFSVEIKRALEQAGAFDVAPFTSAEAALDYLRQYPQDVVIADLLLPDISGAELVFRLRAIQPDIAIIATPDHPDANAIVRDLELQGLIDVPFSVREIVPLIGQAVSQMRDILPDTAQAPPLREDSETLLITPPEAPDTPEFSSLSSVLVKMGGFDTPEGGDTLQFDSQEMMPDTLPEFETTAQRSGETIEFVVNDSAEDVSRGVSEDDDPTDRVDVSLFQRLAAEEPPMPLLEENGTVGDLMNGVSKINYGEVVAFLRDEGGAALGRVGEYVDNLKAAAALLDDESTQKILAQVILETALDETSPVEAFSINELLNNIRTQLPQHQRDVHPLPSWFEESARYTAEPDFLPELDQTGDLSIQTTRPHTMEGIEQDVNNLETDRLQLTRRSRPLRPEELQPPDVLPEIPSLVIESSLDDEDTGVMQPDEVEMHRTDFEQLSVSDELQEDTPAVGQAPVRPLLSESEEDPYIAQLALNLTQVSLELTAEATLLAREGKIVAYSGTLPEEDIEDLRSAIADDWETNPEEARIRFITLPSSGKDYMLYSRKTLGNFTLSMIFAGTMPLRVIRRQSDRLSSALAAVPEVREAEPPDVTMIGLPEMVQVAELPLLPERAVPLPPKLDVGPLTAFNYLWLVRDPDMPLSTEVAQAVLAGLDSYLTGLGWEIKTFRVHEDYIYLLVDAPANPAPDEVIRDLMRRAADIAARKDPAFLVDTLWDDSYFVLTPGRELTVEEVQDFINFVRNPA